MIRSSAILGFRILLMFAGMVVSPIQGYSQRLANIQSECDGHRVVVKYDLENLPRSAYAKVSLSFETTGAQRIKAYTLSGNTMLKASGKNYLLVWDAARDMPGYTGYIEPVLHMDVVKYRYIEFLHNEGQLAGKSYGRAAWRNLLWPGLGMQYISSGNRGQIKSWIFTALVASAVTTHLMARSQYQEYLNATGPVTSLAAYSRANTAHQVAWTLGLSASLWYLTDQISLTRSRRYLQGNTIR